MNRLWKSWSIVWLIMLVSVSCRRAPEIKEKPIVFDELRVQLTLKYMANRYGLQQSTPTIEPKMIVLHWTVFPTLDQAFEAFEDPTLPDYRPDIEDVSGLNVSAHYMVDRDGTIYRLMPDTTMARHIIGLNHCAIGIENVGGADENPLTQAQLKSNIWLVHHLAEKYPIEYLIGHYEYTLFENHELWLEKDDNYRTEKSDPGEEFMSRVRKATKSLNFKSIPNK